ncbi:MAG: peptidylprolyl isomerase [Thermoplasmatales archaeon]|nr:peptidylprolyl isomerase [Thermoplasmatales archaeon]
MPEKITKREQRIIEKQKKMQKIKKIVICAVIICIVVSISVYAYITKPETKTEKHNRTAIIETSMGTIKIKLYEDKVPITTANFIKYANDGFYNGTIFHRVIDNFMIQGGGFYPNLTQKTPTYPPINLEINSELIHVDGAVAMARTSDPNSATSQFYICDGAQPSLDGNYAVFAQVIEGMDVVRNIASVQTHTENGMNDVPVDDVIIISVTISE